MFKAVDLFSGCGGFSLGFQQAGFDIIKAVEFDQTIARTYQRNFPRTDLIVNDIKNLDESGHFKGVEAEVVIGGPPCQGFSMAGSRIRGGFKDDPRNYLFKHYLNVVRSISPEVFVIENVKGMLSMQKGRVFEEIIEAFEDPCNFQGRPYSTSWKVLQAKEFGIPQNRERLFIIGTKNKDIDLNMIWSKAEQVLLSEEPDYFERVNLAEAICDLPEPNENGIVTANEPASTFQRYVATPGSPVLNHRASRHSPVALRRMNSIKPGENYTVLKEEISSVHSGSYGRLRWSELAATITTRFDTPAGGRFTHPELDRTLTPREAARIQSFPDDFVFEGDKRSIARQIGNAVPPKLARFVAEIAKLIIMEGKETTG